MRPSHAAVPPALLLIVCGCLLALMPGARAQTLVQMTNPPPTILENFERQTGTVIVKGFSQIGALPVGNGTVSVHVKEDNDVSHGQKVYGITIGFSGSGNGGSSESGSFIPKMSLVVDYDELDSLINGVDYVSKVTWGVTQLNGFEAGLTTKSGFSVIAHSDRRQGAVATYIQFGNSPRLLLDSDHLSQFRSLLVQGKATLDGLK